MNLGQVVVDTYLSEAQGSSDNLVLWLTWLGDDSNEDLQVLLNLLWVARDDDSSNLCGSSGFEGSVFNKFLEGCFVQDCLLSRHFEKVDEIVNNLLTIDQV